VRRTRALHWSLPVNDELPESRRDFLLNGFGGVAGLAGVGLAGGLVAPAAAEAASAEGGGVRAGARVLPVDPVVHNESKVRIYGTMADGGQSLYRTRGVIYAVLPDAVRPLYAMMGSERSWWSRRDATTWVRYASTLSFFRDLETGAWLDEFTNPLNGRRIKLPASFIRHKEGEIYTPNGYWFASMKNEFPDYYKDAPVRLDWDAVGDVLRVRGSSKFPPILPQPSLESSTIFSSASQVLDRRLPSADAHASGWNIFAWHPYLEMGDAPGHIIWHFDAVKIRGVEDLDPGYLARARAYTPLFDSSPEKDEGPTFFERILQRRRAAPPAR
jgi:hypothetical protein